MPNAKDHVFPLLWSNDVAQLLSWATRSLGIQESWRAESETANDVVEHAELIWPKGKISINIKSDSYADMGPCGIGLGVSNNAEVDRIHALAVAAKAEILQPLMASPVAYSFTARDPDGNQWWVHAETGMLDQLRQS